MASFKIYNKVCNNLLTFAKRRIKDEILEKNMFLVDRKLPFL